ncbi:MAG: heme biosynthesis HemY N-terminal domain-containing protein, partial [Endomicrobiales bacterium]|nr:heme biosynthesis HemY N-terminal domain-containing protein [Endomicrobiales bacterium]
MKRLLFYLIIFLIAVWIGVIMHRDAGYLLISYDHWSLETSLWFAIIAVLCGFFGFYFLLRFGSTIHMAIKHIAKKFANRRERLARKNTIIGLVDYISGNWISAEKKLSRTAKFSDMPLINYLAAAASAQKQHCIERR